MAVDRNRPPRECMDDGDGPHHDRRTIDRGPILGRRQIVIALLGVVAISLRAFASFKDSNRRPVTESPVAAAPAEDGRIDADCAIATTNSTGSVIDVTVGRSICNADAPG